MSINSLQNNHVEQASSLPIKSLSSLTLIPSTPPFGRREGIKESESDPLSPPRRGALGLLSSSSINSNAVKFIEDERLETALFLASLGHPVLPIHHGGKPPLLRNGVHGASTDPLVIEQWWKRWPGANIGLRLDGLLVVDNDNPKHGGDLSLTTHLDAPMVLTPSGGSHHYFIAPANASTSLGNNGIDILTGPSRYVLFSGSSTEKGNYTWVTGNDSSMANLTTFRESGFVVNQEGFVSESEFTEVHAEGGEVGNRNETAYRVGATLMGLCVPADCASFVLTELFSGVCAGLPGKEQKKLYGSVRKVRFRRDYMQGWCTTLFSRKCNRWEYERFINTTARECQRLGWSENVMAAVLYGVTEYFYFLGLIPSRARPETDAFCLGLATEVAA